MLTKKSVDGFIEKLIDESKMISKNTVPFRKPRIIPMNEYKSICSLCFGNHERAFHDSYYGAGKSIKEVLEGKND